MGTVNWGCCVWQSYFHGISSSSELLLVSWVGYDQTVVVGDGGPVFRGTTLHGVAPNARVLLVLALCQSMAASTNQIFLLFSDRFAGRFSATSVRSKKHLPHVFCRIASCRRCGSVLWHLRWCHHSSCNLWCWCHHRSSPSPFLPIFTASTCFRHRSLWFAMLHSSCHVFASGA